MYYMLNLKTAKINLKVKFVTNRYNNIIRS